MGPSVEAPYLRYRFWVTPSAGRSVELRYVLGMNHIVNASLLMHNSGVGVIFAPDDPHWALHDTVSTLLMTYVLMKKTAELRSVPRALPHEASPAFLSVRAAEQSSLLCSVSEPSARCLGDPHHPGKKMKAASPPALDSTQRLPQRYFNITWGRCAIGKYKRTPRRVTTRTGSSGCAP
ncbi:hypothetical protein NDU88_004170 [Pleurodeles waltl]|uniref:Uncharacterized protein n=1 Tax=Pleurodeles waltl TaxID=8319 RepID=A0AAV7SI03_PLEWA|nr:hypothetical protein NDU88_004170 [Pleurodeles waltl]